MSSPYPRLFLKQGKEKSLRRFHPWVFSGAIQSMDGAPAEGDVVDVYSCEKQFLARGHYGPGSIAVKILTFQPEPVDQSFLQNRINCAAELRKTLHLPRSNHTDAYRLINAEGDGLPGLIVDVYGATAVMQFHSTGMRRCESALAETLCNLGLSTVLASLPLHNDERLEGEDGKRIAVVRSSQNSPNLHPHIYEHGFRFEVDLEHGQKTGFFLDQRENRALVRSFSSGRAVLNAFSYSGGFSVYALGGDAKQVHSVDSSRNAIELLKRNIKLNFPDSPNESYAADCFSFLKEMQDRYDLIILDPPAFVKHRSALKNATQGYRNINYLALRGIRPGGVLFTFSCSQLFSREMFRTVLFQSAADTQRKIKILAELGHAADHPVSIYHPEGEYLKGFVLRVD